MDIFGGLAKNLQGPSIQQGQKMTSDPKTNGGGAAPVGQLAALQAKVAEHEARIRNLEGMLGHVIATVTALQTQVLSQRRG